MAQMSSIVSGVASLGVLAGVVSGIFYLVLTGIRWAGRVRAALQEEERRKLTIARCVSCGRAFSNAANPPVVCALCGHRACFDLPCSRPAPLGWHCVVCHVKRSVETTADSRDAKLEEIERRRRSSSNIGSELNGLGSETTQVREFIERIVENILGGSLDGVPVGKLSHHVAYNEIFGNFHEPVCQAIARLGSSLHLSNSNKADPQAEAASSAHAALTHLIEKIAEEAARLPNLSRPAATAGQQFNRISPLHDKSYEDILSTAILNKIVAKYQKKNGYSLDIRDTDRNGFSRPNCIMRQNSQEAEDSDCSDISRSEPLALKIEEQIEEVTTAYESSSDDQAELDEDPAATSRRVPFPEFGVDIVDGEGEEEEDDENMSDNASSTTDVISSPSTWEENWLFQRKKLKMRNGRNPVPVPMLVPNPSQEFRALIGGVDADDVSDLSECSESVLEEAMTETTDDISKTLQIIDALNQEPALQSELHSRSEESNVSVTGDSDDAECAGLSSVDTFLSTPASLENDHLKSDEFEESSAHEDAEDSEVTLVPEQPSPRASEDPLLSAPSSSSTLVRATPHFLLEEDPVSQHSNADEVSETPSSSLSEKDRDVPVDFEAITQIDRAPIPKPRTLDLVSNNISEQLYVETNENPIVCPIAEREKAKWNNAVEMKNNPYTPENIAKRTLSRSMIHLNSVGRSESVEFPAELASVEEPFATPQRKYSRDYYVKAARSPTGEPPAPPDSPLSFRSEASLEENKKPTDSYNIGVREYKLKDTQTDDHSIAHGVSDDENIVFGKVNDLKKTFLATKPPIPVRSKSVPRRGSSQPIYQIISNLQNYPNKRDTSDDKQNAVFEEVERVRSGSITKSKDAINSKVISSHSPSRQMATNQVDISTLDTWGEPAKNRQFELALTEPSRQGTLFTAERGNKNVTDSNKPADDGKGVSSGTAEKPISTRRDPVTKPRKAVRPVHSLTARSIPKDFREGLKISAKNAKQIHPAERIAEIYSSEDDASKLRKLNFDVKGKKSFWENIAKVKNTPS